MKKLFLGALTAVLLLVGLTLGSPVKHSLQPALVSADGKVIDECPVPPDFATVGRCADKCANPSDTLLGFDSTGVAVCQAACNGPGEFVRGLNRDTGASVCGHVTGCPYGDSIPLGPECDKFAPPIEQPPAFEGK